MKKFVKLALLSVLVSNIGLLAMKNPQNLPPADYTELVKAANVMSGATDESVWNIKTLIGQGIVTDFHAKNANGYTALATIMLGQQPGANKPNEIICKIIIDAMLKLTPAQRNAVNTLTASLIHQQLSTKDIRRTIAEKLVKDFERKNKEIVLQEIAKSRTDNLYKQRLINYVNEKTKGSGANPAQ